MKTYANRLHCEATLYDADSEHGGDIRAAAKATGQPAPA